MALASGLAASCAFGIVADVPPAHAVMTYTIREQAGSKVLFEASGSLELPAIQRQEDFDCETDGLLVFPVATFCSGPARLVNTYRILGPQFFSFGAFGLATQASGISTIIDGGGGEFGIGPYVSGEPIFSQSVFLGATLASLGLSQLANGEIATWTLQPLDQNDPYTAFDTIRMVVIPVPGPLPMLGLGAAWSLSRRLRRRLRGPATP